MGAALTVVNVAEDVAVATEATLVASEDEVFTGAAIAIEKESQNKEDEVCRAEHESTHLR